MAGKKEYEEKTEELLKDIVQKHQVEIYDVEYVKEGSDWYLRAYIDKEGGVTIEDCEKVSRELSDKLDEADFIKDPYILEVSSPGLGRTLKKARHFEQSMGQEVEVKTYKAINKEKMFVGILKAYEDGAVIIDTGKEDMRFEKADIASVRLTFDF